MLSEDAGLRKSQTCLRTLRKPNNLLTQEKYRKHNADLLTPKFPFDTRHNSLRKVWGNMLTDNHYEGMVTHSFSKQALILTEGISNLLHFIFKLARDLLFKSWGKQVMSFSFWPTKHTYQNKRTSSRFCCSEAGNLQNVVWGSEVN